LIASTESDNFSTTNPDCKKSLQVLSFLAFQGDFMYDILAVSERAANGTDKFPDSELDGLGSFADEKRIVYAINQPKRRKPSGTSY
jgi:hypothetical protein